MICVDEEYFEELELLGAVEKTEKLRKMEESLKRSSETENTEQTCSKSLKRN